MDTDIQLQATNLSCIRQHKTLFTSVSFELRSGEILLIEGPNGSGKSSLLRLLAGLATPCTGDIYWRNKLICHSRLAYSEDLHYLGHTNGIKLGLTVTENLRLASRLALKKEDRENEGHALLSALQLSTHKNILAKYLSAGQRRRLGLAKLMLFPKTLWILDEPLTALDLPTQAFFLSQLESHLQQGGIAVISSHHPLRFAESTAQTLRLT